MAESDSYAGWAVLELMGHRRLAGLVGEAKVGGATFIRLDVPGDGDEVVATQFYAPAALYCLTPTTEEIARSVAATSRPAPITRLELERATKAPTVVDGETRSALDNRCVACIEGDHGVECNGSWSDENGVEYTCTCPCDPGDPDGDPF